MKNHLSGKPKPYTDKELQELCQRYGNADSIIGRLLSTVREKQIKILEIRNER